MEVSDFVQSALDGFNVCLFSYGQTGSGKTHTMQGSGNGMMRGIIPRAIAQVAESKEKMEDQVSGRGGHCRDFPLFPVAPSVSCSCLNVSQCLQPV